MPATIKRLLTTLTVVFALALSSGVHANTLTEKPSALAMTGDALFARPALLTMTLVGGAVYVVSLPFSWMGGNAGEAGEVLFMGPARLTFDRCLGCTVQQKRTTAVQQN